MAQQTLVDLAKAQVIAYNDKNWGAATEALAANVVYDEVGTNRKISGAGKVIETGCPPLLRHGDDVCATGRDRSRDLERSD